jgi:hypothetical protein
MRKTQEEYLRYLRLKLGRAIRRADAVVAPLKWHLEQNYRWEDEETLQAYLAAQDLRDVAAATLDRLEEFVDRYKKSLTVTEREWLAGSARGKRGEGAIGGIKRGIQKLDQIDGKKLLALENAWIEGEITEMRHGHEIYFLNRFGAAIWTLRRAWTHMFYATNKPKVRRVNLSERESIAFYDVMNPGVREKVMADAQAIADETGRYVEVYDDEGDRVFVAEPPASLSEAEKRLATRSARGKTKVKRQWSWQPSGKQSGQALKLAEFSPEQAEEVRELVLRAPGTTIEEAAAQVGVEVVPVEQLEPNLDPRDTEVEAAADQLLLRDLWRMMY